MGAGFERIQELEAANKELEERLRSTEARQALSRRSIGTQGQGVQSA